MIKLFSILIPVVCNIVVTQVVGEDFLVSQPSLEAIHDVGFWHLPSFGRILHRKGI